MYMFGVVRRTRESICQKKKVSLVVLILYPIYKFFRSKNEFKFMRLQHQCIVHIVVCPLPEIKQMPAAVVPLTSTKSLVCCQ